MIVDVDLDAPENARPAQALEETEFITVMRAASQKNEQPNHAP